MLAPPPQRRHVARPCQPLLPLALPRRPQAGADSATGVEASSNPYAADLDGSKPYVDTGLGVGGASVRALNGDSVAALDATGEPTMTHLVTLGPCTGVAAHIHGTADELQYVLEGEPGPTAHCLPRRPLRSPLPAPPAADPAARRLGCAAAMRASEQWIGGGLAAVNCTHAAVASSAANPLPPPHLKRGRRHPQVCEHRFRGQDEPLRA